ncbi:imelysin family protein [Tamlana sp. 2_MG-2023]|uniref:imelysin family protein n=1 Tax=unclassified Tamlana TaxID=2614803 RepID=UPI0026E136FF|nr:MULTISPECIES: imelysin family protein [unclassified Tamlana]MDO6759310.1 imelysin family protein [Tamlana sp. 2_MG-2023]MDO6790551.1 imelysin family protein [Tamlana sp. 1_MG-2023]
MKLISTKLFYILILVLFVSSCSSDDDMSDSSDNAKKSEFIETYAKIASANYADTYNTAVTMKAKIDAFLAAPSASTLEEARDSWLYARDFYGQTEAYREADGPIDNEDLLGTEGQINAWPLDESFIDYVSDGAGGTVQNGLIGDTSFELTEENIINKNESGKDDNISTGWHAIEFLLWGQDLNYDPVSDSYDNYSVSGDRPFTDYTTDTFSERRKTYLQIVTDLLVKDLKDLNETWETGGSYRVAFENLNEDEALTNILNGIGFISNGEVAAERIYPAIDEGQENEHSCFSDNTNQDMWANVNGINNIIVGSYTTESGSKVSGVSLIDLTYEENTEVATDLENKAKETISKLNTLLGLDKNFDEIISEESLGSSGPAGQLAEALIAQSKEIAEAANTLGVSITIN